MKDRSDSSVSLQLVLLQNNYFPTSKDVDPCYQYKLL